MFILRFAALLALIYSLSLTPTLNDGMGIDPNGGGRTTRATDHRCTIDPNGACTSASEIDRGAGLDPNGSR